MLDKKYNHIEVEKDKYNTWRDNCYFTAGDLSKEPFCIVIPPPNVTGKLHLGHAWDTSLQDIIIRYKKLCGYDALWIPGMDHAGIATQAKIDKKLRDEGINPRAMDREEWLKKAWSWKDEYADNIHRQWARLGLCLDYSRERFTLDEELSKSVKKVFVDLYNKGLIYQGERIINWDPEAMTALSNEEVIYKETKGNFYYLKYLIEGTNDFLELATTRPETLFGDTAVAVNPNDERYKHLIGKRVILPLVNKPIPIIGDSYADMDFGTGVVKITPAHDPNDFEVGERHNLDKIIVMNEKAIMNENAGSFNGMDRFEARKQVVEELKRQNLLIKVEETIHNVGYSERTDIMIEPYLSKQWFVRMRPLADKVIDNQKNLETKVNFIPKRFEKILLHWMEISHDWCISRQLWWGHRIPAWYKNDEIYVGINPPEGEGWVQDNDVLDTWFSSALWPFSTLNWSNNFDKRYFPNDILVTAYDIIFFWVCRMVFQSLEFNNQRPFKDCLIHGLIRDIDGKKMSKSLGNGVDPMEIIDIYGADALRFFLTTTVATGMDLRYDEEKVKATWNFINKLWNASRYVLLNVEEIEKKEENLKEADKWILTKLNNTIKEVKKAMDKYDFNIAGTLLYNFIWTDFCDKYIELSKFNMDNTTKSILLRVLNDILKMMHPFMPYVTEEIYTKLPLQETESIMLSSYPKYNKSEIYETNIDNILEFITIFRNKKAELNIKKDYQVISYIEDKKTNELVLNMLKLNNIVTSKTDNINTVRVEYSNLIIDIIYDNTENKEEQKILLEQEREKLELSIKRRAGLLSNENYLNKAPLNIVKEEQDNLAKEKERLKIVSKEISMI